MPDYTALFEVFGVYARALSQFRNLASRNLAFSAGGETFRSLDRLREEFVSVLNDSAGERDMLECISLFQDAARVTGGWEARLEGSLEAWVRGPVAQALGVSGASAQGVLAALARAMDADGESVANNTVAIGAVMAAARNAGSARCYASLLTVDPSESVINDERALNQSVSIECVRDAAHHRALEGAEEFRVIPQFGPPVPAWVIPVTRGDAPDPRNMVLDGAFELHASGVFAHWGVVAGGSVFSRETAEKLFGGGALKLTGNGSTAADLRQDLASRGQGLAVGRLWALGAWVYVSSLGGGEVVLDLLIDGAPSTLALTINGATPTGQWLHLAGFEYLPRHAFPGKVKVRVACNSAFDGVVLVDGVSLAPATDVPHAGLKLAIFQGALAPQALPIADRFSCSTTSDEAGAFQCLFRDRLGFSLPSSAGPTIDDTLAE